MEICNGDGCCVDQGGVVYYVEQANVGYVGSVISRLERLGCF